MAKTLLLILSIILLEANGLSSDEEDLKKFYQKNIATLMNEFESTYVICGLVEDPYAPTYETEDYRELLKCKDLEPKTFEEDEVDKLTTKLLAVFSPVHLCKSLADLKPEDLWREKLGCDKAQN